MAYVAVFYRPGNLSVVACTTKLAIDNFQHINFIATGLELKTQIGMTDLAAKSYTMKPVGEYDRPHPGIIRVVIDNHITILSLSSRWQQDQACCQ